MSTRTELLERFPLLTDSSARQIGRFERDLTTLRSRDNREHRQQAAENIVTRLRMSPEHAAYMRLNLMIYQDGTSERSTTHRDSHTPSRKRRRTGNIAPPTPEPEEEGQADYDDEGTTLVDTSDGAVPRRRPLLSPGDTPSRAPPAPLQADAGVQAEETPTRGPTVDDLLLENGMLRARLTEAEHEASELQVALAREQGEHMSEREKRMRLKRKVQALGDEED